MVVLVQGCCSRCGTPPNYSLFLTETGLLIGYFEADDEDLAQARMAASDVNSRWQAEMAELFAEDRNPDAGFSYVPEVFNLNDQLRAAGLPVYPRPAAASA